MPTRPIANATPPITIAIARIGQPSKTLPHHGVTGHASLPNEKRMT
jgi:hypothetical protein